MDDIQKFVSDLSDIQIRDLSDLLAHLSKMGYNTSGSWLLRLMTGLDRSLLYKWSSRIALFIANNLVDLDAEVQELVELLTLRQLSQEISYGIVDVHKLSYLQLFYRYVTAAGVFVITLDDAELKFKSKLRLDKVLGESIEYDPEIDPRVVVVSGKKLSFSKIIELHQGRILRVGRLEYYTGPVLSYEVDWESVPFETDVFLAGTFSGPTISNSKVTINSI